MPNWDYTAVYGYIRTKGSGALSAHYSDPSQIWTHKDKAGQTVWDSIKALGQEGWELVSVAPIVDNNADQSFTTYLLYTFKRPLE